MNNPSSASGRLAGKSAIITGGSSGIGLATAKRFLDEGARVLITGRQSAALEKAVAELASGHVRGMAADAADPDAMDGVFRKAQADFGGIDILFLNAGIAPVAPLETMTESAFDELFDINVKGVFFAVQKALPYLKPGTSIVINSSTVNVKGSPGFVAYAASKAAVRSLARGMSAELAPRGIRVNTVSPGPIGTPLWTKTGMSEHQARETGEQIAKSVPAGRFGTPEEIAAAVLYLASDESRYVVGADLYVDGGMAQV